LQYADNDEVVLWANTVGPYHNRQETYSYFSLPFCAGPTKDISHHHETLADALQGVELEFSGLDIDYKGNVLPVMDTPSNWQLNSVGLCLLTLCQTFNLLTFFS
jgi:hypothetical protein